MSRCFCERLPPASHTVCCDDDERASRGSPRTERPSASAFRSCGDLACDRMTDRRSSLAGLPLYEESWTLGRYHHTTPYGTFFTLDKAWLCLGGSKGTLLPGFPYITVAVLCVWPMNPSYHGLIIRNHQPSIPNSIECLNLVNTTMISWAHPPKLLDRDCPESLLPPWPVRHSSSTRSPSCCQIWILVALTRACPYPVPKSARSNPREYCPSLL